MSSKQRKKTRPVVYEKCEGKCWICKKEITIEEMTLDHIIPVSKGGSNDRVNLMAACLDCNRKRKDKTTELHYKIGKFKDVVNKKL